MSDADAKPDRRLHAYRADLADAALKGVVEAERYRAPTSARVIATNTGVYRDPSQTSEMENEALANEQISVFDRADGWAWVQLARDSYVGYIREAAITETPANQATHIVTAPKSFVFAEASIKSRVVAPIFLNTMFAVTPDADAAKAGFLKLANDKGFVCVQHAADADAVAGDYVNIAQSFCYAPYLWGGVTYHGLDCSGLIQMALMAAGIPCPRDTDMQEQALGRSVDAGPGSMRRGDLVFWTGHVAMMLDGTHMIHANAHHMLVTIEPADAVIGRAAGAGSKITSVRRLDGLSIADATLKA
ncbi:MAG: C40 family peptidase [Pseudomonadota bacterium]